MNEILPSGVVVHLDNLKAPSKGKQVAKRYDANPSSPTAGGKGAEKQPNGSKDPQDTGSDTVLPSLPASTDESSTDHVVKPPLPPHLRASLQAPSEKAELVETAPLCRTKHTVILRETVTGLVVVDPKDEAATPDQLSVSVPLPNEDNDVQQPSPKLNGVALGDTGVSDEQQQAATGAVVELGDGTDTEALKQPPEDPVISTTADWQAYANVPRGTQVSIQLTTIYRLLLTSHKIPAEDKKILLSLFDSQTVDLIIALYDRILNSPLRKPKEYGTVRSPPIMDRDMRTNIHHAIRKVFNSRVETSTDRNGTLFISASPPKADWSARAQVDGNNRGRTTSHQKGKLGWQDRGGEHLHFTLYKENKDTMEVIFYLARNLRMKAQSFQFAGTKDRRGITVQRVSVFRGLADRLVSAGRTLRNAKIGNYEYQPSGLQLGQLAGNEFIITLRDCHFGGEADSQNRADCASKIVSCAIQKLQQNGFLNYYGLQRFGTFATRTDTVGMKILQGDFEAAVDAILDFNPTSLAAAQEPRSYNGKVSADDKARAYALDLFKSTRKARPSLDHLPRKFSAEASIIKYLGAHGRGHDYHGALQAISRNLRLMYVHAYQSLVWNVAASRRWKLFGPCVVEGDLVLIDEHKDKLAEAPKPDGIDADGEIVVHPGENDRALNAVDIFTRAQALTKEEANSGKFTIFDIVLPTPGYDILYPANEMLEVYKEFMASERGGGLDPLDMRRQWKDASLSGSYRKLLARPGEDIAFEIKTYEDENAQFVQTDLDRMRQDQPESHQPGQQMSSLVRPRVDDVERNSPRNSPEITKEQPDTLESPVETTTREEKIAVVLKLQLGASQYATMALRELMKAVGVQTYKPDFGGGR